MYAKLNKKTQAKYSGFYILKRWYYPVVFILFKAADKYSRFIRAIFIIP